MVKRMTLDRESSEYWNEMYQQIYSFPEMFSASLDKYEENPWTIEDYKGIAFTGMGGSAISALLIKGLYENSMHIPIILIQGFKLPKWISKDWLLIGTSFSGNTYETNSIIQSALDRNIDVKLITSGGKLLETAKKNNIDVFILDSSLQINGNTVKLQPRAALPMSISPLLIMMEKINPIGFNKTRTIEELIKDRKSWDIESQNNFAKEIAYRIHSKIPIFLGAEYTSPIAYRAKCQLNENSKYPAFYNQFPEFVHNEIESFYSFENILQVITFYSEFLSTQNKNIIKITQEILKEKIDFQIFTIQKNDKISEMLSTIMFWDYVSLYLSHLTKKNPVVVENIIKLKEKMKKVFNQTR